jgi:signal transduction histidine kinase
VTGAGGAAGSWRWRWWRPPALFGDAVLAVAMTALIVLGSLGESYPTNQADRVPGMVPPPWPGYLLVAAAGMALVWRRRRPVAVWAVTMAAVMAYSLLGWVYGAALLAPTIALYTAITFGGIRRALLLGGASVVLLMGAGAVGPFNSIGGPVTVVPFEMAASVCLGLAMANRRAYVEEIRDRAERAERTREEEARRRVDVERLRIARELHDVVAHTMATINVQAAAASHLLTDPPPAVADALGAIRVASKDGLRELRTILNVLRAADEPDPTQPQPGLAQLDALVATTRRAGLPTTVRLDGALPHLPPAVDLAAYRIIQESLTNTLRHAGPATAAVELATVDGDLTFTITDTGHGATTATGRPGVTGATGGNAAGIGGHGLAGMQERATSVGGTLEAGPAPGGGFRVAARLPLRDPATAPGAEPATEPAADPAVKSAVGPDGGPSGVPAAGGA